MLLFYGSINIYPATQGLSNHIANSARIGFGTWHKRINLTWQCSANKTTRQREVLSHCFCGRNRSRLSWRSAASTGSALTLHFYHDPVSLVVTRDDSQRGIVPLKQVLAVLNKKCNALDSGRLNVHEAMEALHVILVHAHETHKSRPLSIYSRKIGI